MAAYPRNEMDAAFRALADPSRRLLLDSLNERNGQTLRELCSRLDMARQSVSKHLAVLEAANLITTVRRGREKLHYLNPAPISAISGRWINQYDRARVDALADLKRALEDTPVNRPSFVYTTYIKTTPERLWQALTEPAFTDAYWGVRFDTDWAPGSPMSWHQRGVTIADGEQRVVESDPYRRLSYTWHTFTPELADALDFSDETRERLATEPRSTVTFEIEALGDDQVKLTVVHDEFEVDSTLIGMVSEGWPGVLSELKTMLETHDLQPSASTPAR